MPFYDYQCSECEHIQEESHPMSGPSEPVVCSACKSLKIDKMVAVPYVKFVGEWQTNQVRDIQQ